MDPHEDKTVDMHMSDPVIEALGGLAGVVLSILGLVNVRPVTMASIASVMIGASFLFVGGPLAEHASRLFRSSRHPAPSVMRGDDAGRSALAEFVGGSVGMILGIVALLGVRPIMMLGLASVVYGATMVLGRGAATKLKGIRVFRAGGAYVRELADVAKAIQALVGIVGIVLGILALAGVDQLDLVLISFLTIGAVHLIFGSTLTTLTAIDQHRMQRGGTIG